MKIDLHCHTTASDGALTPDDLLARGITNGIDMLAITDHDTVAGYDRVRKRAPDGLKLISGVEFSSRWRNRSIHVVGLNFDPAGESVRTGVCRQTRARRERARLIAEKLEFLGIHQLLEKAEKHAGDGAIGRPHFAQVLIENGSARSHQDAFKRFLGERKPGNVQQVWPAMEEVVDWICNSGGTAVLAHPGRYRLNRTQLVELVTEFRSAGGLAMEIFSGNQNTDITQRLVSLCKSAGLLASTGSDFHRPGQPWAELGRCPPLPGHLTPVWSTWS